MEHLEEDLTCPVCFTLFEEPRVLPCSHTFCRRCLESVLQATVEQFPLWRALRVPLKCPSCRHMFDMPSAGLSYLPLNYSLVAIVEKYRRQQKLQCERELAESARPPACTEHSEQPLNVYCLTDRTLVCGFCLTLGEHRSHDIESLDAACAREGRALEESTRALLSDDDDSDGGGGGGGGGAGIGGDARGAVVLRQPDEELEGGSTVADSERVAEDGGGGDATDGGEAVANEQQEVVVGEAGDVEMQGEGRGRRRRTESGGSEVVVEEEEAEEAAESLTRDGPCETVSDGLGDTLEAPARVADREAGEQTERRLRHRATQQQRVPGPWSRARAQLLELEARRTEYESLVTQEAAQAEAYFASLREELAKQQMAVMEYMEAASRRAALGYERAIGALRAVLDEHAAVLALAGEAQDAMLLGEPVAFLQKMHVFRERYEGLRAAARAACPEPPGLGPRCRDYLVRGWADVPLGRLGQAPLPRLPYDGDDGNDGDGVDGGGASGDDGADLDGERATDADACGRDHHLSVIPEEEDTGDDAETEREAADLAAVDAACAAGAGDRASPTPAAEAADAAAVTALIDGEDADEDPTEEQLAGAWLPFEVEYGLALLSAVANLRWADAAGLAARAGRVSESSARKLLGRGGPGARLALPALCLSIIAALLFLCCCYFFATPGTSSPPRPSGGDDAAIEGIAWPALLALLPCLGVLAANALMRRWQQGPDSGRLLGWAAGAAGALKAVGARVRAAV